VDAQRDGPSAQTACVGLGANLGDARAALLAARDALAALPGTRLRAFSSLYRSAPVDAAGPDFVNAVAVLETRLSPQQLLAELQRIEAAHGRERPWRNAPRTLDLDLLLYGEQRIDSPALVVPHPRLHERAFALLPLVEVMPAAVIPGIGPARDRIARVAEQRIARMEP
jgi:2-amino-4-hydroxy-6-hydroxymethyldihydropteridine diphosphokinase